MNREIDEAYREVLSLCRQGQYEKARAACEQLEQLFPSAVKSIVHLRAMVEKRAGNLHQAISLLQTSIDETLEGIANQHSLLRIFVRMRDWEAAVDQASLIIRASQRINSQAFVCSSASIAAYCLVEQGRFEEARDFFAHCTATSDDERIPSSPPSSVGELRKKLARG